jgi:outer membrane protein
MTRIKALLTALVLSAAAAPAFAADLPSTKTAPAAPEALPSLVAYDPWQIRLRVVDVLPTSSNNSVFTTPGGVFVGRGLSVQSQVIPEVDISYYFTPNIAVEAICCVSYHEIKAVNALGALGTVGKTWVFPPTVTLQYHFTNFGAFQPYLGVGVNYTHYFNSQASGGLAGGGPLWINDSWGVALQAGFDYMINRNWGLNADIKYITMAPGAKYVGAGLKSTVSINPVIFGLGITYRFGGGSAAVVAKY